MLFTEHRLWRGTVGFFAGLILAATLGAPALATGYSEGPEPGLADAPDLQVPAADFLRPAVKETSGSGTAASAPTAAPAPGRRVQPARPAADPGTRIALRPGDLDLMAHLVQAEAGDEPYAGKVAVAAVVINRVQSGRFPDSVRGVIFEPDAFEPVSNGWFWNPPTSSAYAAARDALRGWDPSGGALFFFAPAKTANAFVWSRPVIVQIGNHIFSR
ncbi:MAG: cell wall hydrolase [Bacillota bacterium]|nr:cell wall hydrolase [Bacillota bacterium]